MKYSKMAKGRFSPKISLDNRLEGYSTGSTERIGARPIIVGEAEDASRIALTRNASRRIERLILRTERVLTDVIAVLLAVWLTYYVRYSFGPVVRAFPPRHVPGFGAAVLPVILGSPALICLLAALDQYNVTREMKILDGVPRMAGAINLFIILLLIVSSFQGWAEVPLSFLLVFWALCILVMLVARTVTKTALKLLRVPDVVVRNTLILGAGDVGKAMAKKLVDHREYGLRPIGFIDDDPLHSDFSENGTPGLKVLGGKEDLYRILDEYNVEKLIVAFSMDDHEELLEIASECNRHRVECSIIPRLFEVVTHENVIQEVGGIPLMTARSFELTGFKSFLKKCEDYFLASLLFVVSLPVLLIAAVAIKLDSPGPVLFKQKRTGRNGKPFEFYKFRSMIDGADALMDEVIIYNESGGPLFKMRKDPRITRVGRLIRKLSIDELPQLLNVLKGEMSLVGPRPLPAEAEERLKWQSQRLKMRPGITGIWQVSGRSNLPYDEMVKLDLYYIENWSLWLDMKIILKTLPALLAGKGAF